MAPMTMTSPTEPAAAPRGLKGVIVADTELGDVRGLEGFYHYRQYSAPELAAVRTFEDVWYLLFEGELPTLAARDEYAARIAGARHLPPELVALLPAIAAGHPHPLAALRTALSQLAAVEHFPATYDADPETIRANALRLAATTPVLIAGLHRAAEGLPFVEPRDDLATAANYLWMIDGAEPDPHRARAVEQYLILGIDHGFNASTFTARVITSTGADLGAAVVGAIGALSGPLHGGAPSRALQMLDEIGTADRAEPWLRAAVERGDRLMGFGHRVYKTDDPRSLMLREVADSLGGDKMELARHIEATAVRVLDELKPGRRLYTNVEFYAGIVMDRCGIPRELFTPTFAASRVIGWCAHIIEQAADNRLIRPSAQYVGPPPPQPVPPIR
jgi:citrate synthase